MKVLWTIPLLSIALMSCGVIETMRAMKCNTEAINCSTWAIRQNAEAIEAANCNIEENRRQIELVNQRLQEMNKEQK
jgi:methylase of polypeptide subunit release factors